MAGTYTVQWDTRENRLMFSLSGLFDKATWQQWDTAFRAALKQAPRPGWTLLVDVRDFPAQSVEIQKGTEEQMALAGKSGCARIAMVAPKSVTAMQTKRLASASGSESLFAWFNTVEEAKAALAKIGV